MTANAMLEGGLINSDAVLGHYTLQKTLWQPALHDSSSLFQAITSDASAPIEQLIEKDPSKLNSFRLLLYWGSSPGDQLELQESHTAVTVKHRTFLMLAAYHGSLRVLSFLLSQGANPKVQSPDGLSAYDVSACIALPLLLRLMWLRLPSEARRAVWAMTAEMRMRAAAADRCLGLKIANMRGQAAPWYASSAHNQMLDR